MSQAEKPNITNPSRRAVLAGAPAIALTAGTLPAALAASGDAELLALKPEFDRLFELWRAMTIEQRTGLEEFNAILREKTGMTRCEARALDRDSVEAEAYYQTLDALSEERASRSRDHTEAWEPIRDRFYELADEILTHKATSREGLALQARAFVSAWSEVCDDEDGVQNFLASVCAFLGVQFPPAEEAQS
jgi:hypothetical protein